MSEPKLLIEDLSLPFGDWRDQCRDGVDSSSFEYGSSQNWSQVSGSQSSTNSSSKISTTESERGQKFTFSKDDLDKYSCQADCGVSEVSFETEESNVVEIPKIFSIEKVKKTKPSLLRRDIPNKCIVRYLNKYFKMLFRACTRSVSRKRYDAKRTRSLVKAQAIKLGLISNDYKTDYDGSKVEFEKAIVETIISISTGKLNDFESSQIMLSQCSQSNMRINDMRSEALSLIQKVIKNYSHMRLQQLFENRVTFTLLKYFLEHGSDEFLNQVESSNKQEMCVDALRDLQRNLVLHE